jgi:hypothetical protein
MYQWYKGARVCYAYLADVPNAGVVVNPREDRPLDEKGFLCESRWFTRGWTLQELIAPNIVEFYAADCEFTLLEKSIRLILALEISHFLPDILKFQRLTPQYRRERNWNEVQFDSHVGSHHRH